MSQEKKNRLNDLEQEQLAEAAESKRAAKRFQSEERESNQRNLLYGDASFGKPFVPPQKG